MLKEETKRILEESKIVLVVRNIYGDELLKLADAAVSSKLIDKKCRDEGNWDELTRRAKAFTDIAKEFN